MFSTSLDKCRGYLKAQTRLAAGQERQELPVVTISRETGAGAGAIARLLAERLNEQMRGKGDCPWTVFDRNLVERVLEDHNLPKAIKQFMPEDASVFSPGSVVEELLGLHPSHWTLAHHMTDTIFRLARMGNVILIGRGSNVISGDFKNAFHVRLVAPKEARIQRAAELYNLTDREAAIFVREYDRARARYVKMHFKVAIDDPLQYHATLNTGRMSLEAAARLIAERVSFENERW
jgi:cytidylate kinase